MKHIKLFENFMRGGGPKSVLYIYGDAKKNAMGKEEMDSQTSYYHKYINDNTDPEYLEKMKGFVMKACQEKKYGEFANQISKAKDMDYFVNTHNGGLLFIRFLSNAAVISDIPGYVVDGWILPSFYGEGENKFGPGKTKGFVDESELEMLQQSKDMKDLPGLIKALKEFRYNVTDISSRGVITTKNENHK